VEANPGPLSIKEVEIFEFVKKTEERGAEVKRFMETTEKTLAGIDMVITKQTEKRKKTTKGLETGLNKMKTELDDIKGNKSVNGKERHGKNRQKEMI
jgi:hypothetical protein